MSCCASTSSSAAHYPSSSRDCGNSRALGVPPTAWPERPARRRKVAIERGEARHLVNGLLSGREPDAHQRLGAQRLQPFLRERQVTATLAGRQRADLVHDHAAHRGQHAPPGHRAQQHVQRLRRGDDHVRRLAQGLLPFGGRRVAGAREWGTAKRPGKSVAWPCRILKPRSSCKDTCPCVVLSWRTLWGPSDRRQWHRSRRKFAHGVCLIAYAWRARAHRRALLLALFGNRKTVSLAPGCGFGPRLSCQEHRTPQPAEAHLTLRGEVARCTAQALGDTGASSMNANSSPNGLIGLDRLINNKQ